MLIKKAKFSVGDVVGFKLVNGEEIVGKLEGDNTVTYTIGRPLIATLTQRGVATLPVLLSGPEDLEIEIRKESVLYAHEVNVEMKNSYLQATTGIAQVPAGTRLK